VGEGLKKEGRTPHIMTGRDGSAWQPTAYRTHTLGQIAGNGADYLDSSVTVAGYAEAVRGRGAI